MTTFSLEGLKKEAGRIKWPKKSTLLRTFANVLFVIGLFVMFFLVIDFVVAGVIRLL